MQNSLVRDADAALANKVLLLELRLLTQVSVAKKLSARKCTPT